MADSGQSDFINDDVFVEFKFDNFSLDINKQFFSIDNTSMSSFGAVTVSCEGVYKNRLSLSNNYPNFTSKSNDISFKIFDNFYVVLSIFYP